ncbi:hypothetical protein LINPERPRIM_LOCUS14780, partial [Linum perenne]
VLMAAMCGGSVRGDDGDDGRQPNEEHKDTWDYHMIDKTCVFFKKSMNTQRWSKVNGKLAKAGLFDIGPKSWRKVTKLEKDHVFDNYNR